ncbi:hypothetical protein PSECIP111951_01700 [Pseudoalteromonas holothuriae]|uniref:Co-chaperone DjlA N-terminal domain-containing protein n=1 Tax=Pseudoalteromonas holothuriae TaxID=2963714 RepID=A0A9W4QT11_9GAMM|nr:MULTISPECIES: hypothetical protein [unclassified Pseudoalteromonas]CAH9052048.1 hypothetical protein PSECIP111854_00889 [Pseudoalteromonas sp. CIP111854]CAH9057594.1 hypothetical protein PSECIP111951_01700 [Pseudoalteromonas sp. CIP111951]
MKFEQLLNHFDSGICVEQLQKESLLDLALLFVAIDGSVSDSELNVVREWAATLKWNSAVSMDNYITDMTGKCVHAVKTADVEAFIQHRVKYIIDRPMRELALKIVQEVIDADGKLDASEKSAMEFLEEQV